MISPRTGLWWPATFAQTRNIWLAIVLWARTLL